LELFSVGELFMALKARLYDSNKNLVTVTLGTLGFMAAAMGPTIDKHSKVLLSIAVILFMDA
jgi:cytoskeleton-associated protein 5